MKIISYNSNPNSGIFFDAKDYNYKEPFNTFQKKTKTKSPHPYLLDHDSGLTDGYVFNVK